LGFQPFRELKGDELGAVVAVWNYGKKQEEA
jgi:hypothetical protein